MIGCYSVKIMGLREHSQSDSLGSHNATQAMPEQRDKLHIPFNFVPTGTERCSDVVLHSAELQVQSTPAQSH
jgi:hypothetical protein